MSRADGRRPDELRPLEIVPDFLEQPQFFQGASRRAGVGESREEFDHFVHRGVEQIGDGPLFASSRREEALTSSQSSVRPPIRARRWSLLTSAAANFQLKDVLPIAAAVAVRAADEHVAQELHFDFFETSAATPLALSLAGIEAERAGIQAAPFRGVGLGEQVADVVERADVNGGIRTRRLAQSGLVHQHGVVEMLPAGESGGWLMAGG